MKSKEFLRILVLKNDINVCNVHTVYKNLLKNLAGWNLESQSFNEKPIQAFQEKPRFFYAGFYRKTLRNPRKFETFSG